MGVKPNQEAPMDTPSKDIYDFTATRNDGHLQALSDYRGKVLLIVNTASHCGFTPQYQGLQSLSETYSQDGLEVLGFPCDQFAHQEPGTDEEIRSFCELNFGVTFPLFKKVEVNGEGTHPLFVFLKAQAGGVLTDDIKWNFTKFLVDRKGRARERYAPTTTPESLRKDIERLLAEEA